MSELPASYCPDAGLQLYKALRDGENQKADEMIKQNNGFNNVMDYNIGEFYPSGAKKNPELKTALHHAAINGDVQVLEKIWKLKTDLERGENYFNI